MGQLGSTWRARRRRAGAIGLLVTVLVSFLPAGAAANSSLAPTTFDDLIASMKLVVLAQVRGSVTTGYTYAIERTLKGSAGPVLSFGPDLQAAVQPGWTEVVVAFSNPTTDDFRAPTIAWHVTADGTVDPEGYQQYPGLPRTISEMLAHFGVAQPPSRSPSASPSGPDTSASAISASSSIVAPLSVKTPSEPGQSIGIVTILLVLVTAVGGFVIARARRRR